MIAPELVSVLSEAISIAFCVMSPEFDTLLLNTVVPVPETSLLLLPPLKVRVPALRILPSISEALVVRLPVISVSLLIMPLFITEPTMLVVPSPIIVLTLVPSPKFICPALDISFVDNKSSASTLNVAFSAMERVVVVRPSFAFKDPELIVVVVVEMSPSAITAPEFIVNEFWVKSSPNLTVPV